MNDPPNFDHPFEGEPSIPPCQHTTLHQLSDCILRWTWERQEGGTYEPGETHDKILHEDTISFQCVDCGTFISLDDDARIETDDPDPDAA